MVDETLCDEIPLTRGEERRISSDYARMCSYRNSEKGVAVFFILWYNYPIILT